MARRAAFLDLNGTLVMPVKAESLNGLTLIAGADEAIARLSRAGFVCPVVTIQSRIAKGIFSSENFREWFRVFTAQMNRKGAYIVGPYVCPHRFSEPCGCKKPSTFLYELAAREHEVDLDRSFVVGDSAGDVGAAYGFKGRGCLVRTGWGLDQREISRAQQYGPFIANSLSDAVNWVLSQPDPTV